MTTHQRGNEVSVITGIEELSQGRYRGCLMIEHGTDKWPFTCPISRQTPELAIVDAETDVEYAYRRYLAEGMAH